MQSRASEREPEVLSESPVSTGAGAHTHVRADTKSTTVNVSRRRPFPPELCPVLETNQRIPDSWLPGNFRVGIDRSRDMEPHPAGSTLEAQVRQKLITALELTVD